MPTIMYSWKDDHVSFALVAKIKKPDSYREAIEANGYGKWITTMEYEMVSLNRNQTWTLVDLPKDSKVIGCRWVFREKDNEQYKQD